MTQMNLFGDIAPEHRVPPMMVSERELRLDRCMGCTNCTGGIVPIPSTWFCGLAGTYCIDTPECPEGKPLPGLTDAPSAHKDPRERRCASRPACLYVTLDGPSRTLSCTHKHFNSRHESRDADTRHIACAKIPVCPIGRQVLLGRHISNVSRT